MDYIYDNKIFLKNKKVYLIINCGFLEGKQNKTAVNIVKNWCNKLSAIYNGAILIGAGEIVGKRKYRLVSFSALNKLHIFSKKIKLKNKSDEIITSMNFMNSEFYCFLANHNWNKKCIKNGLKKEDIISK